MNIKLIIYLTITLFFTNCTETSSTEVNKKTNTEINQTIVKKNDGKSIINKEIVENTKVNDTISEKIADITAYPEEINSIVEKNNENNLKDDSKSILKKKEIIISEVTETVKEEISKPNHTLWDELLKQNVSSSGKVNYKKLKVEKSKIENYIHQLTEFTTQTNWSKNEKLAYWINLYNAATVKLILDNYPVKSITDLYGGKPWDKKLITIGSKSYTLNNIENDIIRPKFNDARIHFAVNCAAKSCPKLMNGAFLPKKLNYQLNKQAKAFVNGSKNNITANAITISKIFEWYKDDFNHGDLITFLNQYSNTQINPNASVSFNEYDWKLNE